MNVKRLISTLILVFVISVGYAQHFMPTDPVTERSVETQEVRSGLEVFLKSGVIVLDFEGLGNHDRILGFYDGGESDQGFSGENYGVGFSEDVLGLNSGNFSGNPSGVTIMYFTSGSPHMNVPAGFDTGLSLYYCSWSDAAIEVYDEANGNGDLLVRFEITANNVGGACDNWVPISIPFEGTAKSVVFIGGSGQVGFDDVTLGSLTPGEQPAAVPLSALTFVLAILCMAGFMTFRFFGKA